ncbi:MAG: hypothetical protein F4X66_04940 [Chloroflexi bacterium]|nr:hypothetical protein [Chloroflexota bacterium]
MTKRKYDYFHTQHRAARAQAFARSDGVCQFCGMRDANEGHHWEFWSYKPEKDTTADDLTALCVVCHEIATNLRKFQGNISGLLSAFRTATRETYNSGENTWNLRSKLKASDLLSCTPAAGLTPMTLPLSKGRESRTSLPKPLRLAKSPGSANSTATSPFGWTGTGSLPSRQRQSALLSKQRRES